MKKTAHRKASSPSNLSVRARNLSAQSIRLLSFVDQERWGHRHHSRSLVVFLVWSCQYTTLSYSFTLSPVILTGVYPQQRNLSSTIELLQGRGTATQSAWTYIYRSARSLTQDDKVFSELEFNTLLSATSGVEVLIRAAKHSQTRVLLHTY